MAKEIVVAQGMFSKLAITLSEDTVQKMALISKKDNPLAAVETRLKQITLPLSCLFQRSYYLGKLRKV